MARCFLGTSGIVGQGIPQATGAAYAAQIAGEGQVVMCFFGDGAAKQGAFYESLNIASLWKLPIVYVMENNSYNVVTRVEQEDANVAAGEPLSVKARAYSMPGVTVDGGDPVAVYGEVAAAAARLAGEGVSAEVIDLRTLAPLDTATVIESVSKTGHLVLVDQATRHASASAVIAAEVADAGFGYLKAPIKQVTGLDTPIPYSKPMEEHVLPDEDKIVEAVRQVLSTTLVT
ncbi:MAG TPA: thiamine pyrophosphate-dependent enzyme [Streptosporangiaceae bacterium]